MVFNPNYSTNHSQALLPYIQNPTQPNPTQPVLYQTPQKEFLTGAVAYSVTTLRQPTVRLNIYRQVPNHTGFLGS